MVLRPKPEKLEERERTRGALLRATVRLAAHHGFAGLGLREVARGAGIAPTSFYRHFADMEELGLALVAELVGPLLARWTERATAVAAHDPIAPLIDEALTAVTAEPELLRFLLAERAGAAAGCRAALRAKLAQLATALCAALVRAEARPLPVYVAEAAVALLLEGCAEALEREGELETIRARLERQLRWLLSGSELRETERQAT